MGAPVPGPDVKFNFGLSLDLARRYHAMADTISSYQSGRNGLANKAMVDWQGAKLTDFQQRMRVSNATAAELEDAVRATAGLFASAWQHAAGQQLRVEWARHCQNLDNKRSWVDKAWDSLAGDSTKLPPMPSDPPVPTAPDFAPTCNPFQYSPSATNAGAG